jgi:2Fe-2S ferredoxin
MPVLRDAVDFTIGVCGGAISCGTCLVLLDGDASAKLPPPSDDELEMLEALDAQPGSRLACQIVLSKALEGLRLTIAPEA